MIEILTQHQYTLTMISSERHHRILSALSERGFLNLQQLTDLVGASEATLRRDLRDLQQAGKLERVRGGARAREVPGIAKPDHPYHRAPHMAAKRRIAAAAAAMCADGDTIILDGGSTVYQMGPHLAARSLRVLTNSFPIAEYLLKHSSNEVIVPGGTIDPSHWIILNPFDDEILSKYSASTVFMSTQGMDQLGFNNDRADVIRMERSMIKVAKKLVLLVDGSKLEHRGTLRLCTFEEVSTVITDASISEEHKKLFHDHGIELIIAE